MLAAPESLRFVSFPENSRQQKGVPSFLYGTFPKVTTMPLLLCLGTSESSPLSGVLSLLQVPVATETSPLARYTVKAVAGWSKKSDGDDGGVMVASESELRKVPSGPDPLHHHGSTPKNPDDQNKLPHTP